MSPLLGCCIRKHGHDAMMTHFRDSLSLVQSLHFYQLLEAKHPASMPLNARIGAPSSIPGASLPCTSRNAISLVKCILLPVQTPYLVPRCCSAPQCSPPTQPSLCSLWSSVAAGLRPITGQQLTSVCESGLISVQQGCIPLASGNLKICQVRNSCPYTAACTCSSYSQH